MVENREIKAERSATAAWWSAALVAIAALALVVFITTRPTATTENALPTVHDQGSTVHVAAIASDNARIAADRATIAAQRSAEGAARATQAAAETAAAEAPAKAQAVTDAAYDTGATEPTQVR